MDINEYLLERLKPFGIKEKKVLYSDFVTTVESILAIKEKLLSVAQILDLEDDRCLTIAVKEGSLRMNEAVMVLLKDGNHIYLAAYAQEGLITQHTSEKAVNRVRKLLEKQ